jgi:hypothetical protein
MYMQRTTSGAASNGLYTTAKYMRGAAGVGLGATIKHLRRTTSGTAGNGLGATIKYLRRTTSAAANNGLSTTIISPRSAASFEEKLRASHRGTSLGPFVCGARACSLCSCHSNLSCCGLCVKRAGCGRWPGAVVKSVVWPCAIAVRQGGQRRDAVAAGKENSVNVQRGSFIPRGDVPSASASHWS